MRCVLNPRNVAAGLLGLVLALGCTIAVARAARHVPAPVAPAPATVLPTPEPPVVGSTDDNLQNAFSNEMNGKERYKRAAQQADAEGYPGLAVLFRACAAAEQVHADRDVQAIAYTGKTARAVLERSLSLAAADQLRMAITQETWEETQFYPALIARARAEHRTEAVRSLSFALAAEREHVRLLTAAQLTLDQRLPAKPLWVCPYCGRTVESVGFHTCPNCFTPAKKFIKVT